jgi:uncharacterized protein (DUF924 family)
MTEQDSEPDYFAIISRDAVEEAARREDALGALALRMLSDRDERQVFRDGARAYISNTDQKKRRYALAALAATFGVKDRTALKRLLRFWGIVNESD